MHRFHCPAISALAHPAAAAASPAVVILDRDESHHAAKVLRLQAGDAVELFSGSGVVAQGTIESLKPAVAVRIVSVQQFEAPRTHIVIATAIPKGPRADVMIEQLSQLGCDAVIPMRTRRSVVDPRDAKLERFTRTALESAKQCGRAHLMRIEPVTDFGPQLLSGNDGDLSLIATPGGGALRDMTERLRTLQRVRVLIGPEGGFTEEEQREAEAAGAVAVSLGPHILRIETAAVAAVAALRALLP